MNFELDIKRTTMYEQIADKLEEMILSDHINTPKKLPSEQLLAISFGVSRPVIREALMLLNARGLISQKNGEGAYVSSPTVEDFSKTVGRMVKMSDIELSSLFEVRLALEVLSAQLAADNHEKEDIDDLRRILKEMQECKNDNPGFAKLDTQFHSRIAVIGHNKMLNIFLSSLTVQIADMIEYNLTLDGANEDALDYHKKIIEAIESGLPEKAGSVMRNHIIVSMRNAETMMKREQEK